MFLAMPVDDHVVRSFAHPDRIDGVTKLPNLPTDYETATKSGETLWIVCETTDNGGSIDVDYRTMTNTDFVANFAITEQPEFPNDWIDVHEI